MKDNQINALLRASLMTLATLRGLPDVKFKQNFQPRQQGRPEETTVTWHNIGHKRYGSSKVGHVWSQSLAQMVRTESQVIESTYQFSVTLNIDPADVTALTHADVLKTVAAILQSPSFITGALANGMQVLRITDIRDVPIENDRGQFEPNVSFDAIFTHNDVYVDDVPVIDSFDFSIFSV